MNNDSHLNIQSNVLFDDLNSKQLSKLKLTNSLNDMIDPSIEQNNELQIKRDLKLKNHMMKFFDKLLENQGCIVVY